MKKLSILILACLLICSCDKSNTTTKKSPTGTCKDEVPDTTKQCSTSFCYVKWFFDENSKSCFSKCVCDADSAFGNKNKIECLSCGGVLDTSKTHKFLLLKLDYKTNKFEGAKELIYKGPLETNSELQIGYDYEPPGDYGDIKFKFMPIEQRLFGATIIWMGGGQIYNPSFEPASNFSLLSSPISLPNKKIQKLHNSYIADSDFMKVWPSINKLEIVNDYISSNKNIGLYVYTPTVGKTDTTVAKWIVILQKTN